MKLKGSILSITLLSLLLSCSEPIKVTPYTYQTAFAGETSKQWTVRSVQLLQNGKGTQTFGLNTCILDDVYTFFNNSERTYIITEGNSKCVATDPNTVAVSSWSFVNATASLTIIMPLLSDQPLPFILKEVDSQKMVIDIYFDDDKSNYRFNFRAVAGG